MWIYECVVLIWKLHCVEQIVWIMALICVSDSAAEVLWICYASISMSRQACIVFDPHNTQPLWMICDGARLCIWAAMMIQSVVAQVTADVRLNRDVKESWAVQSKLFMWKSRDHFVRLLCTGCPSCYLIAGKTAVGELGFARNDMSNLIEAVSRSVQERRSNQVII